MTTTPPNTCSCITCKTNHSHLFDVDDALSFIRVLQQVKRKEALQLQFKTKVEEGYIPYYYDVETEQKLPKDAE